MGHDGYTDAYKQTSDGRHYFKNAMRVPVGSAPSSPSAGMIYFDTTTYKFKGWSGGSWHTLSN